LIVLPAFGTDSLPHFDQPPSPEVRIIPLKSHVDAVVVVRIVLGTLIAKTTSPEQPRRIGLASTDCTTQLPQLDRNPPAPYFNFLCNSKISNSTSNSKGRPPPSPSASLLHAPLEAVARSFLPLSPPRSRALLDAAVRLTRHEFHLGCLLFVLRQQTSSSPTTSTAGDMDRPLQCS
jgi:hypothetical protein